MGTNRLFLIAAILLIIGVVALASAWHGNAGLNVGSPRDRNIVQFSGEATGLPALIAIVTLIPGAILFLIAFLATLFGEVRHFSSRGPAAR